MMTTRFYPRYIGPLFILLFLVSSCATMADVVKAKKEGTEGTSRIYPINSEQAWEIARTVFRWEGAEAIEEHRAENYMLTSSGMNMVSFGAFMGAWIEPIGKNRTLVTVITKRKVQTNIFTTLTEATFQERFQQAVDIIKAGKKLPLTPPQPPNSGSTE